MPLFIVQWFCIRVCSRTTWRACEMERLGPAPGDFWLVGLGPISLCFQVPRWCQCCATKSQAGNHCFRSTVSSLEASGNSKYFLFPFWVLKTITPCNRKEEGQGLGLPSLWSVVEKGGPPLRAQGGKAQLQNLEMGVSHPLACVWGWGSKAPLRVLVFASGAQEKMQWNAQALWGRLALLGWLKKSGSSGACSGTRERRLRPSCWPKSWPLSPAFNYRASVFQVADSSGWAVFFFSELNSSLLVIVPFWGGPCSTFSV